MSVNHDIPKAITPAVPVSRTLECIVDGHGHWCVFQVAPAIVVKLLDGVHIQLWTHGLVDQLDGRNSRVRGMISSDLLQSLVGLGDRVAVSPLYHSSIARIIETCEYTGQRVRLFE